MMLSPSAEDDLRQEQPRDPNSYAVVTNAIWEPALRDAYYAGTFKARLDLGPFAQRSRFQKLCEEKQP